jgi:hypothetical protein
MRCDAHCLELNINFDRWSYIDAWRWLPASGLRACATNAGRCTTLKSPRMWHRLICALPVFACAAAEHRSKLAIPESPYHSYTDIAGTKTLGLPIGDSSLSYLGNVVLQTHEIDSGLVHVPQQHATRKDFLADILVSQRDLISSLASAFMDPFGGRSRCRHAVDAELHMPMIRNRDPPE